MFELLLHRLVLLTERADTLDVLVDRRQREIVAQLIEFLLQATDELLRRIQFLLQLPLVRSFCRGRSLRLSALGMGARTTGAAVPPAPPSRDRVRADSRRSSEELLHAPILDHPDAIGDAVDKVTVVRHEKDRPFVVFEDLFQRLARGDIEVVRRLVEDQQVRLFQCQLGQRQPTPFPALSAETSL